jgi:tryptophan 2,3-dioxygenase
MKAMDKTLNDVSSIEENTIVSNPVDYWDYISVDTLLSLQKPVTKYDDEFIFISYHQVTELTLNMMLHEIKQIINRPQPNEAFFITKVDRLILYTEILINSFDVMRKGMDYDDYNEFRKSLVPASGFQSVRFRYIEIYCTRIENLLTKKESNLPKKGENEIKDIFEFLYWKDAGLNRITGEKTLTLQRFEAKYQDELIGLAEKLKGLTLEEQLQSIENPQASLISRLKKFDYLYNVKWPQIHLQTASHYLDQKGENKTATGGSEWKKYLDPKYQQRCFFPSLWKENEIYEYNK